MPTVNERCKILRSLNRVYVFEIVLLLVPRLKILRGLWIWDFAFQILRNNEAQQYKSSSQETNHNTYAPCSGLTDALTLIHRLYFFLHFLMNA